MGFLNSLDRRAQSVSAGHPRDPGIIELLGGGANTVSGVSVTPETAMRLGAVFSCIRVLSETLATTPLTLYQKMDNGGRAEAKNHRLYPLFKGKPNKLQNRYDYLAMCIAQANLNGACYSVINITPRGKVELIPLVPNRTTPFLRDNGEIAYNYLSPSGKQQTFLQEEIFRVMFMSFDGIKPLSVIGAQRETIGDGLSMHNYGSRFFANDATPRSYIAMPGQFGNSDQKKQFRKDWESENGGSNQGRMAVLELGMELKTLGISNEDAQFLDSKKYNRSEIAGIFRVPPHMIADLERSTNNNIEHQSLEFITYSMLSWYRRFEESLNQSLLSEQEQEQFYFGFDLDIFLKGDTSTRSQFYKDSIYSGWMSRNEVRVRENLEKVDGLDEFMAPVNMTTAEALAQMLNTSKGKNNE